MPTNLLVPLTLTPRSSAGRLHVNRALEKWVLRHLGTIRHELRVLEIAAKLFDLTSSLHGLDSSFRRLLRMAAIVHDVGRSIDNDTHPRQGARLLTEDESLPLDPAQRRALAYLTRHHRGSVPTLGHDEFLKPSDDHRALATTLGLLRAADALDSRCLNSPRLDFSIDDRRLHIRCTLDHDSVKARKVFTRRKKYLLLESLLDCRIYVWVRAAGALRFAA